LNARITIEYTDPRLDELLTLMRGLIHQGEIEMADLTALADQIAQNTDVTASASDLISQLADAIEAAGTDQAQLDALVGQLRNDDTGLADAVAANTPAATEPTPGDVPVEEPTA
jgi:hypothetical protein